MPEQSSFWQRRRVHAFLQFRGELRQFFDQRGVPTRVSNDLILATQEACNNAWRHGADREGCDVAVSCLDGAIVIEVADRGGGFEFETVKATWPPMILQDDGRGLFLISELTDGVEVVRRRGRGTLVRIVKALE